MNFFFLRQCIVYLLVALLPLQAAAAGRMALCAEMKPASQTTAPMEHCESMAMSDHAKAGDSTSHPFENKGCWLGSVCLASVLAPAIPVAIPFTAPARSALIGSGATAIYRSIILDSPQRPPSIL